MPHPDGGTPALAAVLLVVVPAFVSGCAAPRTGAVPVATIAHAQRQEGRAPALLVFLPGKRTSLGDFDRKQFIDMARERRVDADFIEADLHIGYYLDGSSTRRIWEDIVAPARAAGYERIWLVGISLGGGGAIGFAREHPGVVAGLVLLSPYLGPPAMREEILADGGLRTWTPRPFSAGSFAWFVVENWAFLKQATAPPSSPSTSRTPGGGGPALYLGYGRDEPMGPSLDLLAAALPPGQVVRAPGGHRWDTWRTLWAEMLSRLDFSS